MLSLSIRDKQTLYQTYMPFIQGGGLLLNPIFRWGMSWCC